ncbi:MAG: NAD-dependent epimerase/dehydratase family protein [Verrucomicrobia bacterium]|jgi:nucleoside-diphosphate-sugar epimerase|nr:NAD-dependent epimerase/dehydratase family protein [Verrucomicrobiota bacterium]
MKVLLTGATGFVGSHILDNLRARGLEVRVLLRKTSNRRFIEPHLSHVELYEGGIGDPASLGAAMAGVTHVIHCAGATRATRDAEFYEINQHGTRNVIEAANCHRGKISRIVHISSLAASHPAPAAAPAREEDAPVSVSEYGKSKLAAEKEVLERCQVPFTILRPPAVYGPRDDGFLALFQTVRRHFVPRFSGGIESLSMIFVKDLAEGTVTCLTHPAAEGRTYFVASPEVVTVRGFCKEIARQLNVWTLPLWLPVPALWPVCAMTELVCRLMEKPSLLNRQKYGELRVPGWVCDATRLRNEVGFVASTPQSDGIRQTIAWYRENGWL